MTEQTSANRPDRGFQHISSPLRVVLKNAIVAAALNGSITPAEAERLIRDNGLGAA